MNIEVTISKVMQVVLTIAAICGFAVVIATMAKYQSDVEPSLMGAAHE